MLGDLLHSCQKFVSCDFGESLCFLVRSSKNIWTLGAVSWFRYVWNDKIATVYDVALISQWPEQKHCHVILVRDVLVIFGMKVLSFRITSFRVAREHWFFEILLRFPYLLSSMWRKHGAGKKSQCIFIKCLRNICFPKRTQIHFFAAQALGLSGGAFHSCQRITSSGLLGEHHAFGTYLDLLTLRRVLWCSYARGGRIVTFFDLFRNACNEATPFFVRSLCFVGERRHF